MSWTKEEIVILKDSYGKMPSTKMPLNKKSATIRAMANRLGLEINTQKSYGKYFYDTDFFSEPNIINSYYAGFIAADGCITQYSKKRYGLEIKIQKRDERILQNFKKDVHFTGPISFVKRALPNYQDCVRIRISLDDRTLNDLKHHFNITPQKSNILKPPLINNINALSFIIGYIDGDGWISKNPDVVGAIGTYDLLGWIKEKFDILVPNQHYKISKVNYKYKNQGHYIVEGERARNLVRNLNKINVPIKLERKWNKI